MSRRIAALAAGLFAVLAALAVAGVAPAGASTVPARPASPAPADPTTAAALAGAPAPVASGVSTRIVSAAEALAAASASGADTWTAPALSLQQAAGATGDAEASSSLLPPTWCWATAAWHQWGTWPYEQRITDTTYWCAVYGERITYRTSSVAGSGTLCGTGWTESQLIGGGTGYPWFTMRSSAGFSCPTVIPWITIHPSHYEDDVRTDTGGTREVASG